MHKASTLFQILNAAFSLEISHKIEPLRLEIKVLCIQFKTYFLFSSNTEFDAPQNLLILMLIQDPKGQEEPSSSSSTMKNHHQW